METVISCIFLVFESHKFHKQPWPECRVVNYLLTVAWTFESYRAPGRSCTNLAPCCRDLEPISPVRHCRSVIREVKVKHDVYGKRQKWNRINVCRLSSVVCTLYSRCKLFEFAMNSRRRFSIFVCFIYGLEEKSSNSEVIFAVYRLPLTSRLTSLFLLTEQSW